MKSSIKDKAKGTFREVKGQVKKATGKVLKNSNLRLKEPDEKDRRANAAKSWTDQKGYRKLGVCWFLLILINGP